MENSEASNLLLKKKYDLHKSPEVESAAKRTLIRTGKKVLQDPLVRIENYLNRFHEITDRENPKEREHGIGAVKRLILSKFVTRVKDIPESYWKSQEQILRERGQQGDHDRFSEEQKNKWKKELSEGLLDDQRSSLESWIDYLASPESEHIPDGMKYWIFRNITDLQEYDKEKHEFPKRSKGTVKMFPDINSDALAYVVKKITQKYKKESVDISEFEYDLKEEAKQKFKTYLEQENFAKLYAWANEFIQPIPEHLLKVTDGRWVKYEQDKNGSENYKWLNHSILGRGTGWCTAGLNTAKTQLQGGDFYVFYSNDKNNNPVYPRIAIRMEGQNIAEIRGIAFKQNLDPYVGDVLKAKLEEFPDKDKYFKKEGDMKLLTEIDNKTQRREVLSKEELAFLYEINSSIDGFGYERDPRIEELRSRREKEEDMTVVFNCEKSQIARNPSEINDNTKAYVGSLLHYDRDGKTIPIFKLFQKYNLEHVYASFPEGKITFEDVEIGGKTKEQLKKEIKEKIYIYSYTEDMINSEDFTTLKDPKTLRTVKLRVADLGFAANETPTTDQIYQRAKDLGLDLCPAETGPHKRLKDVNQPLNDWYYIAIKPILDRNGYPSVFRLYHYGHGLWLRDYGAGPGSGWDPRHRFVFSLSK